MKLKLASLFIIIVSFVIAFILYPQMPENMASHWGLNGEVNGYMPKFWGLFIMPILSLGMFFLFLLIPKLDPKEKNIRKFQKYYNVFIFVIFLFLFYLNLLTIFWNLNYRFNFITAIVPPFAILFFFVGLLLKNTRPNWFIGIRTPWTLENEEVWLKTHKLGGLLFQICGAISLLGLLFQPIAFYLVIIPVLLVTFITVLYSYLIYKPQKSN